MNGGNDAFSKLYANGNTSEANSYGGYEYGLMFLPIQARFGRSPMISGMTLQAPEAGWYV